MSSLLVLLLSLLSSGRSGPADPARLKIDPLLVVEAATVWELIAGDHNLLWPGWDASDTPLLLYQPNRQDVLIGHPAPPAGFVPYLGPLAFPGAKILLRDGETFFELDGQNTARSIEGVETLVVADTLSNLRQRIGGLLQDPRPAVEKIESLELDYLATDPYEQMALIAHEAFHVFQRRRSPGRGPDEGELRFYPTLSVENNVGFALEAELLLEALGAKSPEAVRRAALRWLAVRDQRRSTLSDGNVSYEDEVELSEGLAKFVELELFSELQGMDPPDALWLAQGFFGFEDLSSLRERRLQDLRRNLRGEQPVNNDLYGTAPLRFRLYFSGMGIAAVLEALGASWQEEILSSPLSLTELVRRELVPTGEELEAALEEVQSDPALPELRRSKEALAAAGAEELSHRLAAVNESQATLLVIDYSALPETEPALGYTPFGLTRLDDDRTIYSMVPISMRLRPGLGFQQKRPAPLLHDRRKRTVTFALGELLDEARIAEALGLAELGDDPFELGTKELPGVVLQLGRVTATLEGRRLHLKLLP